MLRVAVEVEQGRILAFADVLGDRAAGREPAAGRDVDGAGWLAAQPEVRGLVSADSRGCSQQGASVRMPRVIADDFPVAAFGDAPQVHDGDAIAEMPDDGEVLRAPDES